MNMVQQSNRECIPQNATLNHTYDVVIMGAGFAGNCQARHLLLNMSGISIAMIDPRPAERTIKDLKVGESTVEIGATFMIKDLGLYEYLIENQAPKHGLSFHWPKDPAKTDTVEDYFNVWTQGIPPTESFQLNRAKFEKDVLQMNRDMGAVFYNGRVVDMELGSQGSIHTLTVKVGDDKIEVKAKHLIDAAGRRFLIGQEVDNLIMEPENLYGIHTGAAWVHVKNVDRSYVIGDGYDPNNSMSSHYYTTNHWFGHGHWMWMLPIGKSGNELSIGVVYHKNIIPGKYVNSLEKFKGFLQANHSVVFNVFESGECVDFNHLPRLAHKSKTMISEDNWYVLGDAAHMFDPFYSPGLSLSAIDITSATEVIRAKLAGEADAQKKQEFYNRYLLLNTEAYNYIYQKHENHLGNACAMSWRTYMEDMLWFGVLVPAFIGKWFLDFEFIDQFEKISNFLFFAKNSLFAELYGLLDKVVERNINIGLMDFTRNDQLAGKYGPLQFFDDYLRQTKFEPLRCNVYAGIKGTFFYFIPAYLKLRFEVFGLLGALAPASIFRVIQLLAFYIYVAIGEQIYLFKMRNVPANTQVVNVRKEFQSYKHQPNLVTWGQETEAANAKSQKMQGLEVNGSKPEAVAAHQEVMV